VVFKFICNIYLSGIGDCGGLWGIVGDCGGMGFEDGIRGWDSRMGFEDGIRGWDSGMGFEDGMWGIGFGDIYSCNPY